MGFHDWNLTYCTLVSSISVLTGNQSVSYLNLEKKRLQWIHLHKTYESAEKG